MNREDRLDAYLWDPAAAPDAGVQALERRLAGASFDPDAMPLDLTLLVRPVTPRRWIARPLVRLALAASLVLAAGFGLWTWRWTWPDGQPWPVRGTGPDLELRVGQGVTIPGSDTAIANIARIGQMRIAPGTSLALQSTRGTRHRLNMTQGEVHVRVWAPPLSVVIQTPQGEVIDMGCEFVLSVNDGITTARVMSGWVQFENGIEEVLIPEGASTEMSSTRAPGVPVFDDAAPGFRAHVRAIEAGEPSAFERMASLARQRDVYTLLQLADRVVDTDRALAERILGRAAELSPPPGGVTIASIMRGNRETLWRWANAQGLPSPKAGWWRNWRDALPFWVR